MWKRALIAMAVLPLIAVATPANAGESLCDLLAKPVPARGNAASGQVKDAVVDQAKNLVWEVIKHQGGRWDGIGKGINAFDNTAMDPIVEAATHSEDRIDATLKKFMEGSAKVIFPEFDVVLTGGRVVVGGITYAIEDLYDLTNPGYNLRLAKDLDFFLVEPQYSQHVTEENIGEKVKSEAALRHLWFETYRWKLRDFMNAKEVDALLDDKWPVVLRGWQMTRGAYVVRRFHDELEAKVQAMNRELASRPPETAPPREVFGLWKTPGGSIIAVTSNGGSIESVFCTLGSKALALGLTKGSRQFWGGKLNQLSAKEGRIVIHLHSWSRPQPGDCLKLTPLDRGPYGAKLAYDPDDDTLTVTEVGRMYNSKKCIWADVASEPEVTSWVRVGP